MLVDKALMLDVRETTYVVGLFNLSYSDGDILAGAFRDSEDAPWVFAFRFRYYEPDPSLDPFTDNDLKSAYSATLPDAKTPEDVISFVHDFFEQIAGGLQATAYDEIIVLGTGPEHFSDVTEKSGKLWFKARQMGWRAN